MMKNSNFHKLAQSEQDKYNAVASSATVRTYMIARVLMRAAFPERNLAGKFDVAPLYLLQAAQLEGDRRLRIDLQSALDINAN